MEARKLVMGHGDGVQGRRDRIQGSIVLEANHGTGRNNWGGKWEGRLGVGLQGGITDSKYLS